MSENSITETLSSLKTAVEVNPSVDKFWFSYIDALIKAKQFAIAKQVVAEAHKRGVNKKRLRSLLQNREYTNQKENIEKDVPSEELINQLLNNFENGNTKTAEQLAKKLIQEFPEHQLSWKILGLLLTKMGRVSDALYASKKSLDLNPKDPDAYNNLGIVFQDLAQYHQAELSFKQAISLHETHPQAFYNLGITQKKLQKFDEAKLSYEQAIFLRPNYAEAHHNLGNVNVELGQLEEAESNFKNAIHHKPNLACAHYNLGKLYIDTGQTDNAKNCFEKTLEFNPSDMFGAALQLARLGKRAIPEKTPEAYMKEFYKQKSQLTVSEEVYRGHHMIEDAFKSIKNINKELNILDLGCGTGGLADIFRPFSERLVGVDLSPEMILEAEKKDVYDELHRMDLLLFLKSQPKNYDIIVAGAVLIHFSGLEQIFKLIVSRLEKSGRFLFTIFEEKEKEKHLNSFLLYSHSEQYVSALTNDFGLQITYKKNDIHEFHKGKPIQGIAYVLEKCLI